MSNVPPAFGDISKNCKDLFKKGFNFGIYKLDLENKSASNVEFKVGGSLNADTKAMNGSFEVEKKFTDYGIKINEKWETDNKITTQVSIEDQGLKGSKLSLDMTFFPTTSAKTAKVKATYKRPYINGQMDMDLDFAGPVMHGAFVTGYKGWIFGADSSFDTAKSKILKTNLALGYVATDFEVFTHVNNFSDFGACYYHKLNKATMLGADLGWDVDNKIRFGLASKHKLDDNSAVNAKVDNDGHVGIGYTHKLTDMVELTMSSMIDSKNFSQGGHKVGLGIKFTTA